MKTILEQYESFEKSSPAFKAVSIFFVFSSAFLLIALLSN